MGKKNDVFCRVFSIKQERESEYTWGLGVRMPKNSVFPAISSITFIFNKSYKGFLDGTYVCFLFI